MAWWSLTFSLAILALVAVAIYEHVTSVTLSLPQARALTILTILLPLLAAANLLSLPYFLGRKYSRPPNAPPRGLISSSAVLQILEGVVTTILATLHGADLAPGAARDCELAARWQHLFRAKDARAVRAIQDALQCCGFRSVGDMAWPFPPADVPRCAARFDRALACRGPWADALRRSAGASLGVVLAVGMLQVLGIVLARHYDGRFRRAFSWGDIFRQWSRRDGAGGSASRPLLTGRETQAEEVDGGVGEAGREADYRNGSYGSIENSRGQGPRVEPSGFQPEHNEWRDV